jgi:uncharacterized membrane protein
MAQWRQNGCAILNSLTPPPFADGLARTLLAAGLTGLGVLALMHRDFALQWQPVPEGVPARALLAQINGVALIAFAAALLVPVTRFYAALAIAAYLAFWTVALHGPRQFSDEPIPWLGLAEAWAMAIGAFFIAQRARPGFLSGIWSVRLARLSFAAALILFGLSHFLYAEFTATMIPDWIPARLFFAYLTGAGHVAAGLAIATNILPRLGATLEALMMSCFVVLLHVPRVVAEPDSRLEWTMASAALILTAASWSVAASYTRSNEVEGEGAPS